MKTGQAISAVGAAQVTNPEAGKPQQSALGKAVDRYQILVCPVRALSTAIPKFCSHNSLKAGDDPTHRVICRRVRDAPIALNLFRA